eukprot:5593590-Pyramimonas_sp.AAC.1
MLRPELILPLISRCTPHLWAHKCPARSAPAILARDIRATLVALMPSPEVARPCSPETCPELWAQICRARDIPTSLA